MTWDFPDNLQLVLIDGYPIDVSLSETHDFESEVTEYPVESGSNVADNIRNKPIIVTMEGIVSNTPIGVLDSQTSTSAIARSSGIFPADDAYKRLLTIRDNRQPITISTSLDVFDNMVLQSLSVPRASGGADALHFTAKFIQITMVQNIRTVRVSTPVAIAKKSVTKQTITTTAAPTTYKVYRLNGVYLWYDSDISGWREDAVHDQGSGSDAPNNASSTGWVLYKNKPYGITSDLWNNHRQQDWQYQAIIESAYNSGSPVNQYDPFNQVGLYGTDAGKDVFVVQGVRR